MSHPNGIDWESHRYDNFAEDVKFLREAGESDALIADHFGISLDTMQQRLHRKEKRGQRDPHKAARTGASA